MNVAVLEPVALPIQASAVRERELEGIGQVSEWIDPKVMTGLRRSTRSLSSTRRPRRVTGLPPNSITGSDRRGRRALRSGRSAGAGPEAIPPEAASSEKAGSRLPARAASPVHTSTRSARRGARSPSLMWSGREDLRPR